MNFFTGFLIGMVSLIPGISGGTVLVLTKKYDSITLAITHFKEKKYRFILISLILGIFLGAITFARILEFFFYFFPNATLILFSGFILFQIPNLIKDDKIKPSFFWFSFGIFSIFFISFLGSSSTPIVIDFPNITPIFLIFFTFYGAIDGFFTILPGVSGSMIMMILGPYYLYKSFLASLDIQHLFYSIPLLFYFLGDMIGLFLGSKISLFFLKKYKLNFMSFVFGMVIASAIVLLPVPNFDIKSILFFIFPLLLSYLICKGIRIVS